MKDLQDILVNSDLSDRIAMLSSLFERSHEGIAVIQESKIVYANNRLAEILGYELENILNTQFTIYVHPDELSRVSDIYQRRLAGETVPRVYETSVLRSDGSRAEVEINAGIINFRSQAADFVFIRDITERKQVEAALKHSEEQFRMLVQHLADMVLVIDRNTRINFESPSVSSVLGYPPGFSLGKLGLEFVHPDDRKIVLRDLAEVMDGRGNLEPTEFRLLSASGEWVPVEAVASNMQVIDSVNDIIITARDITRRKKTEDDLRRLMDFNEQIVQGVGEGIILQEPDGRFTFTNPAAAAILGYEPGELIGKYWWDIIPDDQQNIVKAAHKRRMRGKSDRYELQLLRKDGSRITAWVSGSPRFEGENFSGIMAVFTDITERKNTELRARRLLDQQIAVNRLAVILGNLTKLADICKATGDMVKTQMDADAFSVSIYNSKDRSISCGYTRGYGEVFTEVDLPVVSLDDDGHNIHRSVIESGKPQNVSDYLQLTRDNPASKQMQDRLSDGHRHLLQLMEIYTRSILAVPMKVGGETIGVMMVHSRSQNAYTDQDVDLLSALGNIAAIAIHDANLLEQAQQSAQQIEQILQTVPEGMLLLDSERRVITVNPAAERFLSKLTDTSSGEVLDRLGDCELNTLLDPNPQDLWHELRAEGMVFEAAARPMISGPMQGGWVLVIRDVTQEREIERRVMQQDRLATVGQLAAGIAHDFNNIMSTIVLYAQMSTQSPWMSSRDKERMATIYHQAMHATELIRQILDFSRRSMLERQPLSLRPLVKEQVRLFERTLGENISIKVSGMTQRCVVYADPTRIQQVMMNLALNARDAMPNGGTLQISLDTIEVNPNRPKPLPEMAAGSWVRLTMTDNGAGIEAEHLPHIFEPFYTTKGLGEGTGLGLAQVYGIVTQHNGYIDVQSAPGEGSSFIIYLPALPEDLSGLPDLDTGPLVKGRKETILIVEDSPFTRQALIDGLETLNYRTVSAGNGREAMDILLEKPGEISLVLSDVIMPEMSGLALVREIIEHGLDVPTILLTGHFPGNEIESLRNRGLVELIEKPPSMEKLSEIVGKMLKK